MGGGESCVFLESCRVGANVGRSTKPSGVGDLEGWGLRLATVCSQGYWLRFQEQLSQGTLSPSLFHGSQGRLMGNGSQGRALL